MLNSFRSKRSGSTMVKKLLHYIASIQTIFIRKTWHRTLKLYETLPQLRFLTHFSVNQIIAFTYTHHDQRNKNYVKAIVPTMSF